MRFVTKEKKGFTLVELMGIITILVVLSLIIIPIIDKNIVDSKDSMYVVQIENIKIAGKLYGALSERGDY